MIIDTNTSCVGKIQTLKDKHVDTVARYYRLQTHPSWKITKAEAQELSKNNIKIIANFEDYGHASDLKLTEDQGKDDGASALAQAHAIGQPAGSAIYFSVEGLPNGYKAADLPAIRKYFSGIKTAIGGEYVLGVYGDGVVCKTLVDEHICKFAWLAAASCSFEDTCKVFARGQWHLAQLPPLDLDWNGLSVDINHLNPNVADIGAFLVPF